MFASSIHPRSVFLTIRPRSGLRRSSYATYTFKNLRRLQPDELIDRFLTARDDWHGQKEKLLASQWKLKDQFYLSQGALTNQLLVAEKAVSAAEKQCYATERLLKDQLLASERLLKDQLLASETKRNAASESQMKSEIELKLTNIRMRELQITLLRSQNRFNLRGIIESIADQPDYDGSLQADEKVPDRKQGTQPRLDWISTFSPTYARFRQKILKHRGIRRIDFDRSVKSLYHELSKHFHENRIPVDSNADDIIVDMTKAYTMGVFSTLDGAVLESFLHYRYIPYTAITDSAIERYAPVELGGDLERTVMPAGYRDQLYVRVLNGHDFNVVEDIDSKETANKSPP